MKGTLNQKMDCLNALKIRFPWTPFPKLALLGQRHGAQNGLSCIIIKSREQTIEKSRCPMTIGECTYTAEEGDGYNIFTCTKNDAEVFNLLDIKEQKLLDDAEADYIAFRLKELMSGQR